MVDLETTGTDPSHNHIVQLAAVRFNIETKEIDAKEMFDRCLLPVGSSRFWDESTRTWWSQQKAGVLDDILFRGEDPKTVLLAFTNFLARTRSPRPVRLWAKPISFEWPFLQSYMREYGVEMPIPYWNCEDLNSFIDGRSRVYRSRKDFWADIPFEGDQHNALHDCIHQIKGAFAA
jgi:DNA polymerase III alpha subunit (gram-positive type)